MTSFRIYVDSRDRKSGSPTNYEYALPYSLALKEKSLANIDVVVIPNSIQTVTRGTNDMVYLGELRPAGPIAYRRPIIPEGYYNTESLRVAIQDTVNGPSIFSTGDYEVTYNERSARFQFPKFISRRWRGLHPISQELAAHS